jgi:hypothetical protein
MTAPAQPLQRQDPAQLVAPEAEQVAPYESLSAPRRAPIEVSVADGAFPPPAQTHSAPLGEDLNVENAGDDIRPFDWLRHWGFHHSSTEGPYTDRGLPMQYSSWLNRPYHVDWFLGPLLSDGPVDGRVEQTNQLFGGFRMGWDFDYYWGVEWRFGFSNPTMYAATTNEATNNVELAGHYFVTDVDFIYYPWGDTKVRPYAQWGLGMTQVGSVRADGSGQIATLLSMPWGVGVQFPITHWLMARLDITDNLAFGADGVNTLNNFTFTGGMELRLGARPGSYWPWRSSRNIW